MNPLLRRLLLALGILLVGTVGCAGDGDERGTSNRAPSIQPVSGPLSIKFPNTLGFLVIASDPDDDPITLTAAPLPPNATFTDHGDGRGDFFYAPSQVQTESFKVTFSADDGLHAPATLEVQFIGSGSGVIDPPPPPGPGAPLLRTAAPDVVVVVIETEEGEPTPTQQVWWWTVDGQPAQAVGRWSYPWFEGPSWEDYPITMRHHMYLRLGYPLVSGQEYELTTPYGSGTYRFDDTLSPCESIKVNQVGYSEHGRVRFANLAVWLGDNGPRRMPDPILFEVIEEASGIVVHSGQATYWGRDASGTAASGDYVHRIDLAPIPAGGPYYVRVIGYGRSYPFGVGPPWTQDLNYVHTRGLYHQRCGIALQSPYTLHTRGICHTTVEVTDAEPPDQITARGPSRSIRGGYHDAGDYDRRLNHILMPIWMFSLFEAFPGRFTDGQYNIPESGNGIPDWLDEALWGTLVWEELQEADGGVRAGTEADMHPRYGGVNAATDTLIYRTYRRDVHITAIAAGLFAHASRIIAPYNGARSNDLRNKALDAWQYCESQNKNNQPHAAGKLYANCQLYLATGDPSYHAAFRSAATYLQSSDHPEKYLLWPSLQDVWDGGFVTAYFFGYLITSRTTDPAIVNWLTWEIEHEAERTMGWLDDRPYPAGQLKVVAYGSATNQGRYADPCIYMYRLTGDPAYLDAASQLADYSLGLNPVGKCYTTGLGSNPPPNPLHLDSYFTRQLGLGNVPGLLVFGPSESTSDVDYQRLVWSRVYPAWASLPNQRRYCEGWSQVRVQEFTTRMIALESCLYAFLDF